MKKILFALLGVCCFIGSVRAGGPLRSSTTDTTIPDHGNRWKGIGIRYSTNSAILISSVPENSGLEIGDWRFREIVNCSNGFMMLMSSSTAFASYSSSQSVVISSGAGFLGETWGSYGQGEIWALWHPNTTAGGACGAEYYQK